MSCRAELANSRASHTYGAVIASYTYMYVAVETMYGEHDYIYTYDLLQPAIDYIYVAIDSSLHSTDPSS